MFRFVSYSGRMDALEFVQLLHPLIRKSAKRKQISNYFTRIAAFHLSWGSSKDHLPGIKFINIEFAAGPGQSLAVFLMSNYQGRLQKIVKPRYPAAVFRRAGTFCRPGTVGISAPLEVERSPSSTRVCHQLSPKS